MLLALISLSVSGCVEPPKTVDRKTFDVEAVDICIGVAIDMSGSFYSNWDDRAHSLFMRLLNDVFSASAGNECRVVLGQLSASEPIVLFEGRPQELRRRFQSPEDLNTFLQENSDPTASTVHNCVRKMVDYVGSINGVEEGTQMIFVCLSDMVDSQRDEATREQEQADMQLSLKRFREKNGAIALYYVSQDEAAVWRNVLSEAGFQTGDFIIETSLSESPRLPEIH
jgi:hypothetical protein